MLSGIAVNVGQGHVAGEERVPGSRVVHAAAQRGFGLSFQVLLQGCGDVVEHRGHAPRRDEAGASAGAEVVDQVERPLRGVQQPGERPAGRAREQAEDTDEDQQRARSGSRTACGTAVAGWSTWSRPTAAQVRGCRVADQPAKSTLAWSISARTAARSRAPGRGQVLAHGGFLAGHRSGSRRDGDCHHDERGGLGGCAGS